MALALLSASVLKDFSGETVTSCFMDAILKVSYLMADSAISLTRRFVELFAEEASFDSVAGAAESA